MGKHQNRHTSRRDRHNTSAEVKSNEPSQSPAPAPTDQTVTLDELADRAARFEREGLWPQAVEEFRRMLELDPDNPDALLGAATGLLQMQMPQDALSIFDQVLAKHPTNQIAMVGRSVALELLGIAEDEQSREAYRLSGAPVSLAPVVEDCRVSMRVALAEGHDDDAIRLAASLLADSPSDAEAWFTQGIAEQRQNRLENALVAYENAVKCDPKGTLAWLNYGAVLHQLGRIEEARDAYEMVLQQEPHCEPVLWNLALLHIATGNLTSAAQRLDELLGLCPANGSALFERALIHLQLEEFHAADAAFERCRELLPDSAPAAFNSGVAHYRLGNWAEANSSFATALQAKPGWAWAHLGLSAAALLDGRLDHAFSHARHLPESFAESAELLYNLALTCEQEGRSGEAATRYLQAVRAKPDFAQAWVNLGHILEALGYHERAVSCWKQALGLDSSLYQRYFD